MAKAGEWCPVLKPTKQEFERPFVEYVASVFQQHPDLPMFKVVPPQGWKPRRSAFPDVRSIKINTPIRQHVFGTKGAYRCVLVEQKEMTVADFKKVALAEAERVTGHKGQAGSAAAGGITGHTTSHVQARKALHSDDDIMERSFWSSVTINPPLYGADTPYSFFDKQLPYGWNLRDLGDLLRNKDVPEIPGVTTPMTYFGMWRSFFGWHKEDADLLSINFLHFGAPKVWYGVSPADKDKFDRMAAGLFPELAQKCKAFIRHKDILISPSLLRQHNIPYMLAKQQPGEFIVLNAAAYHAGFNMGFNCAEAINFATEDWIDTGKAANVCTCEAMRDCVRISMKLFDPTWVDPYGNDSESESDSDSDDEERDSEQEEGEGAASGSNSDTDTQQREGSSEGAEGSEEVQRGGQAGKRERTAARDTKPAGGKRARGADGRPSRGGSHDSEEEEEEAFQSAHGTEDGEGDEAEEAAHGSTASRLTAAACRLLDSARRTLFNGSSRARQPPTRFRESSDEGEEQVRSTRSGSHKKQQKSSSSKSKSSGGAGAGRSSKSGGSKSGGSSSSQQYSKEALAALVKDEVVGDPAVILGDNSKGKKTFSLVQRINRPPSERGYIVLRWLKEGDDGLFRPVPVYWEEKPDALVSVRTQLMTKPGTKGLPTFKLLTLRSRILDTDLVD